MPIVVVLALALLLGANALAGSPDLASMDWSANAPHSLAANPPSDGAVGAFLSKLYPDMPYPPPPEICYARFADLRHSGTLSLVVSYGDGRTCFLSVIDKTAAGYVTYSSENDGDYDPVDSLAVEAL